MKSKTSFFNRTLFFGLFKRFWPLFTGYLVILLIMLPLSSYSYLGGLARQDVSMSINAAYHMVSTTNIGGTILSFFACIAIAMASFGYLYNARSASMMGSLPIKRQGIFLTFFTSGICWMLLANAIAFAVLAGVLLSYGVLNLGLLLQAFAMLSMMNLFFFGFASLCASLTGHIAVLPILYGILNFAVFVVEFAARILLNIFVYGLSTASSSALTPGSPAVQIIFEQAAVYKYAENAFLSGESVSHIPTTPVGVEYNGFTMLIIYAVVGLLLAGLAMLLVKRRRMETASDVISISVLKPIFKYCLTFGCALVLGMLIFSIFTNNSEPNGGLKTMLALLTFVLLGGFVGYFGAEMLLSRTLRVFATRRWIGFGVSAVIIVVVMLGAELDFLGFERHVPAADDISSVTISYNGDYGELEQPENVAAALALHQNIIKNKAQHENLDANTNEWGNVFFTYTLKNERQLIREYQVFANVAGIQPALNDLLNSKEAVLSRNSLAVPVVEENVYDAYVATFNPDTGSYEHTSLSPAQVVELYNTCLVPDLEDLSLGKIWLSSDDSYYTNVYACEIRFQLQARVTGGGAGSYGQLYLPPTLQSHRTNAWLEELGLTLFTLRDERMYNDTLSKDYEKSHEVEYPVSIPSTINSPVPQ